MPAKDKLHEAVVRALLKDGWTIAPSQTIKFNGRTLYLDIVAEKKGRYIVVEVKGTAFDEMAELEKAIGQYLLYRFVLGRQRPVCTLFLAAPQKAFEEIFGANKTDGPDFAAQFDLNFLVFDPKKEEIIQWIQ